MARQSGVREWVCWSLGSVRSFGEKVGGGRRIPVFSAGSRRNTGGARGRLVDDGDGFGSVFVNGRYSVMNLTPLSY
jgi:hypothetical protein